MDGYRKAVEETAEFLSKRLDAAPVIGVMTGTGLGQSLSGLETFLSLDYALIPNFPVSTVQSHAGRLLAGRLADKPVLAMQGRFHLYEGYTPREVAFPVRVMQALGVRTLIVTNAAGGLNLDFSAGDIMVIVDHLNLTGENPLLGPNVDEWGARFPDMTQVYNLELIACATAAAKEMGLPLRRGVYAGLKGPSLETPAEMRFLRQIGADAVGLSTVQEVIAAVHGGMRVLGLSTITNINDPDHPRPTTVEAIIEVADRASKRLGMLISAIIKDCS